MTGNKQNQYNTALARCYGELTTLTLMLHEYQAPEVATDEGAISELEDLARRLSALTANWQPREVIPAI